MRISDWSSDVCSSDLGVERVDRSEAGVAGAGPVMPFDFEVGEERADERRVELTQVETRRRRGDLVVREAEQEPERVAVGGNGVGAGGPLRDETRSEEHTSELQSLMRTSNGGFCLKKKN